MAEPTARVLAFYLPQFHPIPENDLWWGAGFTEWTNVAKARPLFPGHVQPRLPADLGFYDLRVPEVREQQARLARSAGVESFCYWHYWFGDGRRILERPFEEVLASRAPDFPFCLAWANQSWTGIWHGNPGTTLMRQEYPGREDEEAHFRWALRAFRDERYTRVDGRPVFVIFAPHDLPSTRSFIDHWQTLAQKAGLPGIYFVAISNLYRDGVDKYRSDLLEPFDAVTLLSPQDYIETYGWAEQYSWKRRLKELNFGRWNRYRPASWIRPTRIDFADVVHHAFEDMPADDRFLPTVLSGWDNTPRSNVRGTVYEGFTADLMKQYLQKAVDKVSSHAPERRIVFIKAWNEWAEGNIIEPCAQYGHSLLEAVQGVVMPSNQQQPLETDAGQRSAA